VDCDIPALRMQRPWVIVLRLEKPKRAQTNQQKKQHR
jgi:hypothetical protein